MPTTEHHLLIDDTDVILVVNRRATSVVVEMLITKDPDTDPIMDDTVAVIVEAADHEALKPTGWPKPGELPEVVTLGATANGVFTFANRGRKAVKRVYAVLRGGFAFADF